MRIKANLLKDKRRLGILILVFLVLTGAGLVLWTNFGRGKVEAAWFDDSWGYRKAVTLTVASNSSDITNLETLLTIDTTGITSKLQSSCQDLRFTNQNGKSLPYYIDSCSNNSATNKVWVMADLVPKNTTTYTLYMYYGNPSAAAASNSTLFYDVRGLVGYWTMNESSWTNNCSTGTVIDSSIDGYNAKSCPNSTGPTGGATGQYANGGSFDGSDDYVDVGSTSTVVTYPAITVSAWFKPSSLVVGNSRIVANSHTDSDLKGFQLMFNNGGATGFFDVGNGTTEGRVTWSQQLANGSWYHYVGTYDGANVRAYINGILVAGPVAQTGSISSSGGDISIGENLATTGDRFNGIIDDVRIYNRALSAGEVSNLFSTPGTIATTATATSQPTASFASEEKGLGPVAYWKFDDASGTSAKDSTVNNYTGTLSGATKPAWQTEDQCEAGKCLYFDGSTSYVSMGNVLDDDGSKPMTISAWINFDSNGIHHVIAGKQDDSATGYLFYTGDDTENLRWSWTDSTGANILVTSGSLDVVDGQWHHVVGTYDGSKNVSGLKIYVDGVDRTATLVGTSFSGSSSNTAAFYVGGRATTGSLLGAKGFIDNLKEYNYVRTSDQAKVDYNSGKAGAESTKGANVLGASRDQVNQILSSGLQGYWKMDDNVSGDSKSLVDSSGNGNTATTHNGANASGMDCSSTIVGKFNMACHFDATDDYVSVANTLSSIQTVAFWASPSATTLNVMDLNGTNTITMSSGLITANSFSGTTQIYVNGVPGNGTLTANTWNHVVITTTSGISASAITMGKVSTNFYGGRFDEVRMYNRVLSPSDVQLLYNWAPGPVGYWQFEDGAGTKVTDSSGNGNNGTWGGSGTSRWTQGKFGKAGNFVNSTDYVSVTRSAVLEPAGAITISGWVKLGSVAGSADMLSRPYVSGTWTTPFASYLLRGSDNSGKVNFNITLVGNPTPATLKSTTILTTGSWYFVTAVYDGTKMYVYLNGKLDNSSAQSGIIDYTNATNLDLGTRNEATTGEFLNGQMDELRIYNYARTPGQIVQDMNGGHPLGGSPVGSAVGYWKFDEGYGTVAHDSGVQPNSGTLTSMATIASVGTSGWNPSGKFGKAISFDGVDDYVDFGDLTYTESQSQLSWSLWVNPNALATKRCLLCKFQNTTAANKESWAIETGNSNSNAVLVEMSTNGNATQATGETPAGVLTVGKWTHIVVTYDGTASGNANMLKIYINGIPQTLAFGATAVPASTFATTSNARAGASSDGTAARFFSGTIDEVKIYNGTLTQANVLIDYNRSSSTTLGVLGVSTFDGKTASNSAGTAYCIPGDTSSCNGPVAEWNFEERQGTTANDTSGNNNSGTLTGTTGWTTGKFGAGTSFDGTSSPVNINDATSMRPANFTLSGWVNLADRANDRTIFQKNVSGGESLLFYVDQGSGLRGGFNCCGGGFKFVTAPTGLFPLNQWVYVAFSYDGATLKLYQNGNLIATTATTDAVTYDTGTAEIGGDSSTGEWSGKLDQLRIYNYARTASQIAYEYNRGLPQSWWKFDECQGTVAHDSVGSVSGTLNSGTPGTCNTSSTAWFDGKTGKNNYSLFFGSAPDLTTVTSTSTYPFSLLTSTSASWGGWFKPTSSINSQGLIDKNQTFRLYTNGSGNAICSIYYGGAYHDAGNVSALLTLNAWNHVVCTYDGVFIRTYVNGVLKNYTANTNAISVGVTTLYVGQLNDGSDQFTGQADDVKVWNYSLTAYQVLTDFNQNSAVRFGPLTGAP